jgi:acyl-coenzyme A thioesterase PaaI-like protein
LVERDRHAATLGIELVAVGDSTVTVSMPVAADH